MFDVAFIRKNIDIGYMKFLFLISLYFSYSMTKRDNFMSSIIYTFTQVYFSHKLFYVNVDGRHFFKRPLLWSMSNIVTSHAADPVSIPGRFNFLVESFSGVSLQP